MPAKRIIILERLDGNRFRYALWADVPLAKQSFYADPAKRSAWASASVAENADIAAGRVIERVETSANVSVATLDQIKTALENEWTRFQNFVTNFDVWQRYGTYWDGTSWTPGGVL